MSNIEENPEQMPEIDLTKVKNLEAVEKADSSTFAATIKQKGKENARKEAKRKFNFAETSEFRLPSGGRFYQDSNDADLKKGIIKLLPMGLAEEEILTNRAYLKNSSTFRVLYDTCVQSDYPAKKLLSYDALYLMYCLRQITYGESYNFKIKCDDCGKEFPYEMNISDIDFEELKEKSDEREIELPVSKFTVTMRLLRLGDEEEVARLSTKYEENEEISDTILNYFVRTTSIRDDKGNELSPDDWLEFYSCLPLKDKEAIKVSFKNAVNDPKVTVVCPKCGNKITMSIPMSEDFFRLA
jgi:DNA-directed RNA polymerase subunit RPC12/RpoP